VPVQRNKRIDGFLNIDRKINPIPIRVQRENETFESARKLLLKAISKNGFKHAVLMTTNTPYELSQFSKPRLESDAIITADNINLSPKLRQELQSMYW
jgi:hypothetical protein